MKCIRVETTGNEKGVNNYVIKRYNPLLSMTTRYTHAKR